MIQYTACPSCGSSHISVAFTTTDFSISKELFSVCQCATCHLMFTQNVPGPDAITKYYQAEQYISHSDTAKGFVNKLYHRIRKRTLNQKRALVKKYSGKRVGSILDIGSGTGAFLNTMQQADWQITGIEPDAIARKNSERLYQVKPLQPSESTTLATASFDAITMWHVLEHVHDLPGQMAELNRLLAPGGTIFIAVPNHQSWDARKYGKYWAAWDLPRHLYHFSPESMQALCSRHGLSIKKMLPMWFDSFYVSMLSEKYRYGKTNLFSAFFSGLISNMKAWANVGRCSSIIYIVERKHQS